MVSCAFEKRYTNSAAMLSELNEELKRENDQVVETEQSADNLAEVLEDLYEELKVTKRQRIRDIMKHLENEEALDAMYDEMESELQKKISGLNHQIGLWLSLSPLRWTMSSTRKYNRKKEIAWAI